MRKRHWPDQDDGVELLPDLDNVETVGSLFEFHGRFVVYKIPGGSKLPSALKLVTRHVNRSPKSVTTYRLQVESPMRLRRLNVEFRKFLAGKAKLGKWQQFSKMKNSSISQWGTQKHLNYIAGLWDECLRI